MGPGLTCGSGEVIPDCPVQGAGRMLCWGNRRAEVKDIEDGAVSS